MRYTTIAEFCNDSIMLIKFWLSRRNGRAVVLPTEECYTQLNLLEIKTGTSRPHRHQYDGTSHS